MSRRAALIQSVQNPYSGTPPTTSEYNITTDYQVDDLGRTVQTLGPTFNSNGQLVRTAAWTVYDDCRREVRSAGGFATGSNSGPQYAYTLVNPVSIARMDLAGRTIDVIGAVRERADGPLAASDRFPQRSWTSWTHSCFNNAGDLTKTRAYHKIPKECLAFRDHDDETAEDTCATEWPPRRISAGFPGEHYDEATFGYDVMDRQNMVRSPGGTITRTVFDVRNQATQVYVGTDDVGATDAAPDGGGVPGNNMVNVTTNVYDGGNPVGGDGLVTTTIQHIDGTTANDRQTAFAYDFRDRQTTVTAYIVPTGTVVSVVTVNMIDNLDRVVQVDQYNTTVANANRIRESQTLYDNLGRPYQTLVYAVPITGGSAGTPSTPQTSNTWFDAKGQVVKSQPAGAQSYTKTLYDQVSRPSGTFSGYAATGGDNPWTVGSADHILEQVLLTYDLASNTTQTVSYQRNQGATSATGQLTSANSPRDLQRDVA